MTVQITDKRKHVVHMPDSMKMLPIEYRSGLPIPIINSFGFQDHDFGAINTPVALHLAQRKLCGVCGERFEQAAFLGGPRNASARAYTDPPLHEECAKATTQLCPHMSIEGMKRATERPREDTVVHGTGMKPASWVMYVADEYQIYIQTAEDGTQVPIYVPAEDGRERTFDYVDGRLVENV